MSDHVHEFKKRVYYAYECPECGADGHPCEACGTLTDIDVMRSDAEGCWFCPKCWAELTEAAAPSPGPQGAPAADPTRKEE